MKRPPRDRSRRQALRIGGAIGITAIAGCLAPFTQTDSCTDGSELSLDETTDVHISNEFSTPLDDLPHATQTVVTDAVTADTGEATARGYYSPHPQTEYVVTGSDSQYYHVETTDFDRAETTGYEYSVEIDVDESSVPETAQVHSFTALPTHDRESLLGAIGNPRLLHAPHYSSFSVVFAYEQDDKRDRSLFVPGGPSYYLEWDETLLRVTFDEQRTVAITTTRVSTELVAESLEEFVAYLGRERGVVLDSLTDQQRDIVDEAIEDTYTECEPYSEPFGDLRESLSPYEDRDVFLTRYDGTWYFTHLSR